MKTKITVVKLKSDAEIVKMSEAEKIIYIKMLTKLVGKYQQYADVLEKSIDEVGKICEKNNKEKEVH